MNEIRGEIDSPRSPIIRVRKRRKWNAPLPKTTEDAGQIVGMQNCITEQAATPSCSPLSKSLMVQSPLVAATASIGQEANTPSLDTYCSAVEMICRYNAEGNILSSYTDSVAKENTQEVSMSLEFCDTYCSNAEQLMKLENLTEDIDFDVSQCRDSQSTSFSDAAIMPTIDTQDYLQTQNVYVSTQFSTNLSDTSIKKNQRGRKKKESPLETPPDSGSFSQSQKLQDNSKCGTSKRIRDSAAKSPGQARQKVIYLTNNSSATQNCFSWNQHNISSATRAAKPKRSSQKDAKEEVSNLVDCVRAIRKQVRVWVVNGDNNSNKSQVLQDIANIVQQAHQLQNKYGASSDLEHVLQACEAVSLQLRYVPHQSKIKSNGKGATRSKRQIVSKQDDVKVKTKSQDTTSGLPSIFNLINANILQPGRMNLCLLISGCIPSTASISNEGYIQSSSGILYETVEHWCQDWTKDLSIFRKEAYTSTLYRGQSIMSLCPDTLIHNFKEKIASKEKINKNKYVNSIKQESSPSLLSSTNVMKQDNESRKKSQKINITDAHCEKVTTLTALNVKDVIGSKVKREILDPPCAGLGKPKLAHDQSDEETYFSGDSYSPQISCGNFSESPYLRSPSLKSSDSENEVSLMKKVNVTSEKGKKRIEKSAASLVIEANKKTVENEIKSANENWYPPNTIDVKNYLSLDHIPVVLENKGIKNISCLENTKETIHEPSSGSDLQERKSVKTLKISDANFLMDLSSNCAKTSITEEENPNAIRSMQSADNTLPQLITSIKSGVIEKIEPIEKCTEIKPQAVKEKTVTSLKLSQFVGKVDAQVKKSPEINTTMLPNELLKLKAKTISLLKKLDNQEIPNISDFTNLKEIQYEPQSQTDIKVDTIQCKVTPEKQCAVDMTYEDEQEAWRIETKTKMLGKWNAEVQEWGNQELSQIKTPVDTRHIPHFVPAYKTTEADSQNCECITIQLLEQLAVMTRNVQDMVSQLSGTSSLTTQSSQVQLSQKFNASVQQQTISPLPKLCVLKSNSQAEDILTVNQEFCGGSQGTYTKISNWESSNPRLGQRISFSQGSQDKINSQNFQSTHIPRKPMGGRGIHVNKTPHKYTVKCTPKKSTNSTPNSNTKHESIPCKLSFVQTNNISQTPNKQSINASCRSNNTPLKHGNLSTTNKYISTPFQLKNNSLTKNNVSNTPRKEFGCVSTEIKTTPDNKSNSLLASFEVANQWIGEDFNVFEQQQSQGNGSETKSCTEKSLNEVELDDWSSQPWPADLLVGILNSNQLQK